MTQISDGQHLAPSVRVSKRRAHGRPRLSVSASFADQAFTGLDQALRSAGVETNDPRISLALALSSQALRQSEKVLGGALSEAGKYVNPKRDGPPRNLEEALMAVPDLESFPQTVLFREREYEIRAVESYLVAETTIVSREGFDFMGASRAFNTLAGYLFGKNTRRASMEMTTPVVTQRDQGQAMEMTTPVVSSQESGKWRMSFLLPSEYDEGSLPVPTDADVNIRRVPRKVVAAVAFSGFVNDADVVRREADLRRLLLADARVQVKPGAVVEVAQYNPPFTLPFQRRNEILLEVELVDGPGAVPLV